MSPDDNIFKIIAEAAVREVGSTAKEMKKASMAELVNFLSVPDLSVDLEDSRIEFQLDCLQQSLKHLNENHTLRLSYTGRIYWLVVGWLACVVIYICWAGFAWKGFVLPEKVLLAFITSTTVTVVGLFVLVAKWMYPPARKTRRLISRIKGCRNQRESSKFKLDHYP